MATVYLHIGAPKTATSTLQALLARNYSKLLRQGVLYPRDFRHGHAHHVLVCDLIDKYQSNPMPDFWYGDLPRGQAWPALCAEIDRHGPAVRSVVLSSELFFGQAANVGPMLRDVTSYLHGHDVKVVVYLRRQDQLYSSFFNQDVKGVRQWAENAYSFYETHQIFQRDYFELMTAWGDVFGSENVLIRPYEPAQWRDGDIVSDFCAVTGIPPMRGGRVDGNESLGPNQLYIKQCLNRVGYDKSDNDAVLDILLKLCPEESRSDMVYINRRAYTALRERWQQVNLKISEQLLQGAPLFHTPIPTADKLKVYWADKGFLLAFIRAMLKYFQRGKAPPFRSLYVQAAMLLLIEQQLWPLLEDGDRRQLMEWV